MIDKIIRYIKIHMHLKWCLNCKYEGPCKRFYKIIEG